MDDDVFAALRGHARGDRGGADPQVHVNARVSATIWARLVTTMTPITSSIGICHQTAEKGFGKTSSGCHLSSPVQSIANMTKPIAMPYNHRS